MGFMTDEEIAAGRARVEAAVREQKWRRALDAFAQAASKHERLADQMAKDPSVDPEVRATKVREAAAFKAQALAAADGKALACSILPGPAFLMNEHRPLFSEARARGAIVTADGRQGRGYNAD
jgi:hypothetical protein